MILARFPPCRATEGPGISSLHDFEPSFISNSYLVKSLAIPYTMVGFNIDDLPS